MFLRYPLRIALALLLCLAISTSAFPQSSPALVPIPSSTGATILLVVSAVVTVAVVYIVLHKRHRSTGNQPSFVGCTEPSDHGPVLTDERDGQEYVILPGSISVKLGERVQVLAKKDEDDAGRLALQVGKLVKDYGPCKAATPTPNPPAQPQ